MEGIKSQTLSAVSTGMLRGKLMEVKGNQVVLGHSSGL